MAVLPGLDANDETKTVAVLTFFVAVLSAVPRLRGAGDGQPGGEEEAEAAREEEEEHGWCRRGAGSWPPLPPQPFVAGAGAGAPAAGAWCNRRGSVSNTLRAARRMLSSVRLAATTPARVLRMRMHYWPAWLTDVHGKRTDAPRGPGVDGCAMALVQFP